MGLALAWIVRWLYEAFVLATRGLDALAAHSGGLLRIYDALTLGVLGGAIYLWCQWQVRALSNEEALRPRKRAYTPTESLLFYLVPVISMHRPFEVIMTMYRDAESELDDDTWGKNAQFVGLWWFMFWASLILFGVGYGYAPNGFDGLPRRVIAEWQVAHGLWGLAAIFLIISAWAALKVIGHINRLQEEAFERLEAASSNPRDRGARGAAS